MELYKKRYNQFNRVSLNLVLPKLDNEQIEEEAELNSLTIQTALSLKDL